MSNMIVRIGGDATKFKQTLNDAKGSAKKAGDDISTSLMGKVGAGVAVGALVLAGKKVIDVAESISEGAERLSITTDEYQRLSAVAAQCGTDMSKFEAAFSRLAGVLSGAEDDSETATKALAAIGLSYRDLAKLDPSKQFEIVAQKISAIQDPVERLGRAQEIFGSKGALSLMPLIQNYGSVRTEIEKTQILMDEDAAKSADRLKDSISMLTGSLIALAANTGVISFLETLAKKALDVSAAIKDVKDSAQISKELGFQDKGFIMEVGTAFWENVLPEGKFKDRFRKGAAAIRGGNYQYGNGGIVAQTAPLTDDDIKKAKQSKEDEKKKEDDRIAAVDKQRAAKDAEKAAEEARKKEKKDAEKAAQEAKKAAEEKIKQQEAAAKQVADMEHELQLQKMILDGKAREAAIEDEIYKAKQRSSELTQEQLDNIGKMAGELYDINEGKNKDKNSDFKVDTDVQATALERIGAIMGGGSATDATFRMQSEHVKISKESLSIQRKILDKTGDPTIGSI